MFRGPNYLHSVGPCAHIIKLRPTIITEIPADIIYIGE